MVTKRREMITQWRGVVRQNNGNLIDCCSVVDVPVLPRCDAGLLDNRLLTFEDRIMVTKRREMITQWRGVVRQNNENLIDRCSVVDVSVLPRCDTGLLDNRLLTFGNRIMVTKRREMITQWRGVVRQNNGNLNFFLRLALT